MQTYYILDGKGYWTGQTKEEEDGVGVPGGYALMSDAPPHLEPGDWAVADGDKWIKTTEDPNPPTLPPPPPAALLPKSLIQERVNDLGKLQQVFAILNSQPIMFARWFAPDWPNVNADDAGLHQILAAVGLTDEQIAQVTATP